MVKEEEEEGEEGRLFECVVKQTGGEAHVKDAKRAWDHHPSLSEPGSAMKRAPSGREERREEGREAAREARRPRGAVGNRDCERTILPASAESFHTDIVSIRGEHLPVFFHLGCHLCVSSSACWVNLTAPLRSPSLQRRRDAAALEVFGLENKKAPEEYQLS